MKRKACEEIKNRPIKVLQFGSGCLARGVWCRLLQEMDDVNSVIVCDSPQNKSRSNDFYLGLVSVSGETEQYINHVNSIINPYIEPDAISAFADNKEITTVLWAAENEEWILPNGKMKNDKTHCLAQITMFLFGRFCLEMHGVTVIPSTPFDFNGDRLKKQIIEYSSLRGIGMDFINWLNFEVVFINTSVECISQGVGEQNGKEKYICEKYLKIVTDKNDGFISQSGYVSVEEDISVYYKLKRFVFEGALVSSCAYALLHDVETVSGFMMREKLAKHMTVSVFEEILPSLHLDFERAQVYAMEMLSRFENSYLALKWSDIAQKLIERFANVTVPVIIEYIRVHERVPKHLTFALFCTIQYYRVSDEENGIKEAQLLEILKNDKLWGCDLSFLCEEIKKYEDKM